MPPIDSKEISLCFAEVWSIATAKRGTKAQFFKKYGIDQGNLFRALRDMDHHNLDVAWIAAFVLEFNASPNWILTGRGEMFEKH